MRVRTTREIPNDTGGVWPIGTERDAPDAYWWLRLGVGEPVDDEAIEYQKVIDAENARRKAHIERMATEAIAAHEEQRKREEAERISQFESILLEGT